ncbi:MAG: hypothetical protein OSA95_13405 [Opitutales bacterium]|nr:hypothetical protein [Opitutales bacterium]
MADFRLFEQATLRRPLLPENFYFFCNSNLRFALVRLTPRRHTFNVRHYETPTMITKILARILLLAATPCFAEDLPGDPFDYNFDGHMDYRVLTVSNARASQFDVFIFNPKLGRHVKDETLSGLIYPYPDPKTKRVNSIFTGGHSGALFTGTVYTWNGKGFEYAFSVRQENVQIDGKIQYIRVKAKLVDGKPQIFSVEPGDPQWDDKGMSIE